MQCYTILYSMPLYIVNRLPPQKSNNCINLILALYFQTEIESGKSVLQNKQEELDAAASELRQLSDSVI